MNPVPLIIQLLTGALGGNATGKLLKNLDLGLLGNSLAGIVGGGLGGQLLNLVGMGVGPSGSLDLMAIIGSVASGGVGGGVLMVIVGIIKSLISKGNAAA